MRLAEICILTKSRSKRPCIARGIAEKPLEQLTPISLTPLILPTEKMELRESFPAMMLPSASATFDRNPRLPNPLCNPPSPLFGD